MNLQEVTKKTLPNKTLYREGGSLMDEPHQVNVAGWREWVELPDIGVTCVESKVDTGTRATTLHTSFIEHYRRDGELWVRFCVNPIADKECLRVVCQAPVKSTKTLQASDKHEESFFVIESTIKIGDLHTRLDLALKNQGCMKYMMHLGRNVLQDLNIQVDPKSSYLLGDSPEKKSEKIHLHV